MGFDDGPAASKSVSDSGQRLPPRLRLDLIIGLLARSDEKTQRVGARSQRHLGVLLRPDATVGSHAYIEACPTGLVQRGARQARPCPKRVSEP